MIAHALLITAEWILLAAGGLFLYYLAALSVLALFVREQRDLHTPHRRRFAVIVPAHDEEVGIGATVRNLLEIDYPVALFDVIVIADNCTDRTADIARSLNARVLVRDDPSGRGKGKALRWCFDGLMEPGQGFDAFVVVDADSMLSQNVLRVLNFYIEKGAQAIQIAGDVARQPGAWNSEILRLAFTLYNRVRPMGKKVVGGPVGLRGNGMCFTSETLRRVPWGAYSLTEDIEYGLMLLLEGIRVHFAPEAMVTTLMPAKPTHSRSQRARWEIGRFPVVRRYAPLLFKEALRRRSIGLLDAFVDVVMPPFMNMLIAVALIAALHAAALLAGVREAGFYLWCWASLFVAGLLHVAAGLAAVRADASLCKSLAYVPRYAAWKLSLYAHLLTKGGPKDWIRTPRERGQVRTPN